MKASETLKVDLDWAMRGARALAENIAIDFALRKQRRPTLDFTAEQIRAVQAILELPTSQVARAVFS